MSGIRKITVSVINDLVTDQRVNKVCLSLLKHFPGSEITLVGRKLKSSMPLNSRTYQMHRMNLLFENGFLFYAEFNFRLFFYLIKHKSEVLVSNDLDTLLPNYLTAKLRGSKLVYDSHEYFTEVPELTNRPFVQGIWKKLEKALFPRLKAVITVNDSIAELYHSKYGIRPVVIKNVPFKRIPKEYDRNEILLKHNLDPAAKYIILQGSGININRGAEEAVMAMKNVHTCILLIVGGGDVIEKLKKLTRENKLGEKVVFLPKMEYGELMKLTQHAELGLTLDKDTNINYRFSLPNKLFDYLSAGIAVLASSLPEIKKIIDENKVGALIDSHNPEHIADKINYMIKSEEQLKKWKENALKASEYYCWENEEEKLIKVYSTLIND